MILPREGQPRSCQRGGGELGAGGRHLDHSKGSASAVWCHNTIIMHGENLIKLYLHFDNVHKLVFIQF